MIGPEIVLFMRMVGARLFVCFLHSCQSFVATSDEHTLEFDGIPRVGTEEGVCEVSKEGDEADGKIDYNVQPHFAFDALVQASLNFLGAIDDHPCHEEVHEIARGRYETDDAAPPKLDTANVDRVVESVCATLDLSKDFGIVGGDAFWDWLLLFARFAVRTAVGICGLDGFEVRVLCDVSMAGVDVSGGPESVLLSQSGF